MQQPVTPNAKSQEDKARKNSGVCEGKAQDSTTQTVKEPDVFSK